MLPVSLSTSSNLISLNSSIDITCIYHSSPAASVFYTAETSSRHQTLLRSPFSPLGRLGPMFPDMRPSFPSKQRQGVRRHGQRERAMSNDMSINCSPSYIVLTSASSFDHHYSSLFIFPLFLSTRGFRLLPITNTQVSELTKGTCLQMSNIDGERASSDVIPR